MAICTVSIWFLCTVETCNPKRQFRTKLASQIEWLQPLMYSFNMFFQASTSSKARITNGTLKWLLPLMICCNMSFQVSTLMKAKITNGKLEFLSLTYTFDICTYLLRLPLCANITLELLLSLMYSFNMFFYVPTFRKAI